MRAASRRTRCGSRSPSSASSSPRCWRCGPSSLRPPGAPSVPFVSRLPVLVASASAYVANVRRPRAAFCRHLTLQPHGLLVGPLLVGPPPVVFALALVVFALALVDSLLL